MYFLPSKILIIYVIKQRRTAQLKYVRRVNSGEEMMWRD